MCTTAALSPVPPPVRLEQERRKKHTLSDRTQATVSALGQYLKGAGSPQLVASAVAAFQRKPTWMAAVSALKKQKITRAAMAAELAGLLHVKAGSSRSVITGVKNGKIKKAAADLVLAVRIFIIEKYQDKCGGLFR